MRSRWDRSGCQFDNKHAGKSHLDEALLDTTNDLLNLSLIMKPERENEIGLAKLAEIDITIRKADNVQATESAERRQKRKKLRRRIAQLKTKACILCNRPLNNMRQDLEKYHSVSPRVRAFFLSLYGNVNLKSAKSALPMQLIVAKQSTTSEKPSRP